MNLLLETIPHSVTAYGEWVNVMGYVTGQSRAPPTDELPETFVTSIQAIVYWSAGPISIEDYEKALVEMQGVGG